MKRILIVAVLVIAGAVTLAQQPVNVRVAKAGEVPFVYNADDFNKVMIEGVPKAVVQAGDLPTEAPAHSCFHLEDKRPLPALDQGPRYFYPAHSTICIIPLTDTSEGDYAKSYPYVHEAAAKLRKLLARRPAKFKFDKELYDLPFNNAAGTVQSKVQYLDFKTGKGILFLTQYSQDAVPTPVNNEELTCDFRTIKRREILCGGTFRHHSSFPSEKHRFHQATSGGPQGQLPQKAGTVTQPFAGRYISTVAYELEIIDCIDYNKIWNGVTAIEV